ncbi:glycoside hydrolase family 2 protein [Phlyctochytrium arcticum]|nr:glycoside hydrolase family 2 protein [Phlyctochytrium arcticum]
MTSRNVIVIDKDWVFRQANKPESESRFLPVAGFPTNIHLDLLANGLIADPFIGKNELDVQWVGDAQWLYRATFSCESFPSEGSTAALVFDGLDTFATISLNGTVILETDNMFIPYRREVTSLLLNGDNELMIHFDSASLRGWKLVEKYPEHKWGVWNGDNSRLAVRKAQYHWGWDWGPVLNTCGPWRPIRLEIYSVRLSDLYCDIDVDESLSSANVSVTATVDWGKDLSVGNGRDASIQLSMTLEGESVACQEVEIVQGVASASFHIGNPALWYPIRYGKQPLYQITATLKCGDEAVDEMIRRIGLRKAELVQQPLKDQPGTSFFFKLNNIPLFCGGSNWIPADSFIPRISRQKYFDWVRLVAEGNQFMLRVWGGGIYEQEDFYDACDEYGILVWQDFMFGCGNYPTWPAMLQSIETETQENVKRLRHHPCIVIWAGNNEDYQYQETAGLTYDYEDKNPDNWLKTDFPARYIYEKLLSDVCAELCPKTFYHPGSPWGAGRDTHDPTVGDIHQWNVWHGTREKYQNFDKLVGRFVSEFGMEAFPNVKTIDAYLPEGKDDPDRYSQSSTVDFHNKADGHERRLALYLVENIRYAPEPLEQFVYSTQLMQAECHASAYRLWKRQWKGPGAEYCGGALVWQINDCWPVTSWSIVDYYLRPKHAYFAIKREMAPVTVGLARREHRPQQNKANDGIVVEYEVWGCNLTLADLKVDVVYKAWNIETGKQLFEGIERDASLPSNRSTEITVFSIPSPKTSKGEESRTVVAAYLLQGAKQIARYVDWPQPLKYLHLQKPQALHTQLSDDHTTVEVSAEVPVKGLVLECQDDAVMFDDNLVDIVPGEVLTILVKGARQGTEIATRYSGMI